MYCADRLPADPTGDRQRSKPNQWTYKLLCLYVQGWAEEGELIPHLEERIAIAKQPA